MNLMLITRVAMFIALGAVYYFGILAEEDQLRRWWVIILTLLLIANHFIQFYNYSGKWRLLLAWLDFVLCSVMAYQLMGVGGGLYLIYFGALAVTVFLTFEDRRTQLWFVSMFFLFWIVSFIIRENAAEQVLGELISFMFVVHGVITDGLIRKLAGARVQLEEQHGKLMDSHLAL